MLAEVRASRADVVCLQECNRFAEAWLPGMRALGYDGVLWQKPRSPCERYGADRDGLALFWRAGRLRLAAPGAPSSSPSFYSGPYRHLAPSPAALATLEEDDSAADAPLEAGAGAAAAGAPPPPLQLEAASQGLIVAVLEEEAAGGSAAATVPPRRVVVAVTHLKAKEGFEARRREQAAQLCEVVRSAVESGGGGDGAAAAADGATAAAAATTAVLVAGDFNAAPDSAAAKLVRASPAEGGLGLRCLWDVPLAGAAGGSNGRGTAEPTAPPGEEEGEDFLFTTWKFRRGGDAAAGGGPPREKLETIDHIFYGGAAAAAARPPGALGGALARRDRLRRPAVRVVPVGPRGGAVPLRVAPMNERTNE
jgi:endonuclease/exonuclease/phosphatase family metal-dependent hydrolase